MLAAQNQVADPIIFLHDQYGSTLATSDNQFAADPCLSYRFERAGEYYLQIRDVRFGSNSNYRYCIEINDRPLITTIFPLAIAAGRKTTVRMAGFNLPNEPFATVNVSQDAKSELVWKRLPLGEDADTFNSDGTKNNKWQIKITNVNQFRYYSVYQSFDEQLTYYEDSQEYIWEYDTSRCGTGQNACFNVNNAYNLKYNPSVNSYSYTNCAQVAACKTTEPGLTMNAQNGPQMSTIWFYSASAGKFGMVGLGTSTGIDQSVSGTPCDSTTCTNGGGRDIDDGYSAVRIPGDITMKFGTLSVNATFTYSTSTRNWFCVNSNNHPLYFTSSNSNNPYCLYSYTTWQYDRQFNGWQAPGYDGRWMPGASITQKVSMVRPMPDVWPPDIEHGGLMDTYSTDGRTVTVNLADVGEPPSGVNVSQGTDSNNNLEGPHIFYRTYDADADRKSVV